MTQTVQERTKIAFDNYLFKHHHNTNRLRIRALSTSGGKSAKDVHYRSSITSEHCVFVLHHYMNKNLSDAWPQSLAEIPTDAVV